MASGTPQAGSVSASPDVVAAAIAQVEQGFAAFALRANAKVPITEHGFKNATTKPEWIATQLKAPHAGNYGIVWPTEAQRRVLAFDLDNGSDGRERPWQDRLLELIERIGPLPRTKATTTPSGGRHAFYGWPDGVPLPPGDELFGFTVRWPGRGYLVGPGSSIDGRPYLAGTDEAIADLPTAWVYAAIAEHALPKNEPGTFTITGAFQVPDIIPSGRRYATVRDYVASRYNANLSPDELWELVRTQVAPRFSSPKTDLELRGDFDRVMAKITERLGPPAHATRLTPEDAVAAVSPIEVRNLADIAVEAVVWLWHRYLPVGSITLFDGNPGEGKSTIVADVIARLTRGTDWPDGTPVGAPGSVLYITKEDDASTQVRPRIEAAGGDARQVSFVAADLLFPRDAGRFRELLEATRPRLVLLDPLMSYLEGRVKVISDNEVRSALMTPLAEIARAMSCVVLVIRHFNKGSGQSALMRGAGSLGGLAGAARMVLALTPDPESDDDRDRVFGVVKSNYEAKPPSLKASIESAPVEGFQMTVSRVAWHGESATSVSDLMERTRDEHQLVLDAKDVLRELLEAATGPVPASEIHAKMKGKGHSKGAVYNAARSLHVHIEREGFPARTVWSLTAPSAIVDVPSSRHSDADARTTVTTGRNGSHPTLHESQITGTTVTTGESSSHLTHHSGLVERGHSARPRAREGDPEPPVLVAADPSSWAPGATCHWYVEHQAEHFWAADGWRCTVCSPAPGATA